jgi:hypothetical protein
VAARTKEATGEVQWAGGEAGAAEEGSCRDGEVPVFIFYSEFNDFFSPDRVRRFEVCSGTVFSSIFHQGFLIHYQPGFFVPKIQNYTVPTLGNQSLNL